MFKIAKNIDTAFRQIRSFSLVVSLGCIALCCFTFYRSAVMVEHAQSRVYILESGKILEAFSSQRKDNVPVEARDHVSSFHWYFFSLEPDDKLIQSYVVKALYLADGSAKKQYDNLREAGFYNSIISSNISQSINPDSIQIDARAYPYYFKYYGVQTITRATSVVSRSLITEGYLRNTLRSDNNPHGFLIEQWRTLENKDISVRNR
ncbi:conjugative transposon protein TraK [Dyadobacter psychrotolerans]|uniref:Conjugative transposon protein TraK n=1 Tax=Dyadobacter psychrotolerans TaxID=2541721 RepID=A0A4R5DML1_9BACT|nr:conjugative transposon protein TraK [Dyadobacter psychrotolerans]TDE14747.1 conjugative transposon protein TraK [Dyadobacter psychrotolerans]